MLLRAPLLTAVLGASLVSALGLLALLVLVVLLSALVAVGALAAFAGSAAVGAQLVPAAVAVSWGIYVFLLFSAAAWILSQGRVVGCDEGAGKCHTPSHSYTL